MLMLGHTIATSGNLLKTGLVFGMNPLALNWAQILAIFPVTMSWVRESIKRDRSIRTALDAQWLLSDEVRVVAVNMFYSQTHEEVL